MVYSMQRLYQHMHIPTVPPRPTTSIYCTQRIAAAVTATKQNKKKKKTKCANIKKFLKKCEIHFAANAARHFRGR